MHPSKYWIPIGAFGLLFLLIGLLASNATVVKAVPLAQQGRSDRTITSTQQLIGALLLQDNEAAPTGSFLLQLARVKEPPDGSHYELWLYATEEDEWLDLGPVDVAQGTVYLTGTTEQPLLAAYDSAFISIEQDNDRDRKISAQIFVSSSLSGPTLTPLRTLLIASEDHDKGYLWGAAEQVQILAQHTGFLRNELAADDFDEARRHTEHVINIMDGEAGFLFGDLNRDGLEQNPGDGFGLQNYLQRATTPLSTVLASVQEPLSPTTSAGLTQPDVALIDQSQALVVRSIDKAMQILSADTIAEAQPHADELGALVGEAITHILDTYTATLQLAQFPFYADEADLAPLAAPTQTQTTILTQPLTATLTGEYLDPEAGTIWRDPILGAEYVYVPGGEFTLGADAEEALSALEGPAHTVTVTGVWLGRTEVTNEQYGHCVASGACTPPANETWAEEAAANEPVTHVSWAQAQAYAAWAGGRLPSEAEWERACRGDDGRLYPWGTGAPTAQRANYNNTVGAPVAVGSYPAGASPYGLLDLSGNVWEWTSSLDQPYPYDPDDGREEPADEGKRILRGGSFYYTQYQLRCTTRSGFAPDTANQHFGFRIVRSP
jgi:formylglycine-generating enzyme required for sulfatase activity